MRNPPLSSNKATLASLFSRSSCMARSTSVISSSISSGNGDISGSFSVRLVHVFVQQQTSNHVQGLEHALAFVGAGRKGRHLHLAIVQEKFHVFHRRGIREIAFVV